MLLEQEQGGCRAAGRAEALQGCLGIFAAAGPELLIFPTPSARPPHSSGPFPQAQGEGGLSGWTKGRPAVGLLAVSSLIPPLISGAAELWGKRPISQLTGLKGLRAQRGAPTP